MDKKKLTKKSIDIESEFVGLPVAPRKKKEPKDDMTDHIKEFLSKDITIESIKSILLKIGGVWNLHRPSKINIHYVEKSREDIFLIVIEQNILTTTFILSTHHFIELCYFSHKELSTSLLKNKLLQEIVNFLKKNIDKVNTIS
jgi:hypothetical protein